MGGPIFWEWGHQGLSGYFLLSWDNEGIGPPPLANLKPQSPYSGEHLRVSDIFLERVVLYILVEPALHFVAC